MTAMDIWLLLCLLFVALVTLEYAILLAVRFGNGRRVHEKRIAKENKGNECNKMDRISLRLFTGIYVFTVGSYFYVVTIQRQ